jgi:hypothetical protein
VGPAPALVLVPVVLLVLLARVRHSRARELVVRLQPLVPSHLVLGAAVVLERLPSRQSF